MRARIDGTTRLLFNSNGGLAIGTSSFAPTDGVYVHGDAGIGTTNPNARLSASDDNWQLSLLNEGIGGGEWYLGSSRDGWAAGGGKLVINNESSSGTSKLVVDSTGNVGIDIESPEARLHVRSGTDTAPASGGYIVTGNTTGSNISIDSNEIMARNNGSTASLTLNADGGEVRINVNGEREVPALRVLGDATFDSGADSNLGFTSDDIVSPNPSVLRTTGFEDGMLGTAGHPYWRTYSKFFFAASPLNFTTYSDRSLKKGVRPIPDALDTILRIDGVTYELDKHPMDTTDRVLSAEEEYARTHQLGFIAQDVEAVLPQLVTEDEATGLKTVGYMGVIPILVEAIKAQQAQIVSQRTEMEDQRAEIETLKNLVSALR